MGSIASLSCHGRDCVARASEYLESVGTPSVVAVWHLGWSRQEGPLPSRCVLNEHIRDTARGDLATRSRGSTRISRATLAISPPTFLCPHRSVDDLSLPTSGVWYHPGDDKRVAAFPELSSGVKLRMLDSRPLTLDSSWSHLSNEVQEGAR